MRLIDLRSYLWGPVFERVRDPKYFGKFRIDRESGTIVWPNGADIDPDVLYLGLSPAASETPAR